MSTKPLQPMRDLLKVTTHVVKKITGHVRHKNGKIVADGTIEREFTDHGRHVKKNSDHVQELLETMSLYIIEEDWIRFDSIAHEVKALRPSMVDMSTFFKNQIKDAFVRQAGMSEIDVLRRKLKSIGASEEDLDAGVDLANTSALPHNQSTRSYRDLICKLQTT